MVRRSALWGAGLVLGAAALLMASLQGLPLLAAAGSLGVWVGLDGVLRQLGPRLPERAGAALAALQTVLAVEQGLVLVLVLRAGGLSPAAEDVAVVAVVLLGALRLAQTALQLVHRQLRFQRISVRNLPGAGAGAEAGADLPPVPRALRGHGLGPATWPGLVLSVGAAVAVARGAAGLLLVAAALAVVLAGGSVAAQLPALVRAVRAPRGAEHRRLVAAALAARPPEVVLYAGGGPGSVYAATAWLSTLERIRQPSFVLLRDPAALERLGPTSLPVVCAPAGDDVLPLCEPAVRVSLFPVNETENARLLRSRTVRSAFVGHGDSDKSGSTSPLSRAYDEVWVAGPAGRERYRQADVGVRDDAVREVGRPQSAWARLAPPRRADDRYTVLYAPTWEGLDAHEQDESSVAVAGQQIMGQLLALGDVRVLYRPHPRTGSRLPAVGRAHRALLDQLREAGPAHEALTGDGVDLQDCFARADALVTDVSSVIPDFLACGRPYFVVDVRGLPADRFRHEVPSAAAAYLVGPEGQGLVAGFADARSGDSLRAQRQELREHLLGPGQQDPYEQFARAVDALARLRRPRTATAG